MVSAAVIAIAVLALSAPAQAALTSPQEGWSAAARVRGAAPVSGGRYIAHIRPRRGVSIDIRLTLANDGREFAKPSSAAIDERCTRDGGASDDFNLSSFGDDFRSVQVRHEGRFRYRVNGDRLVGRFIDRGRVAVGTVSFARLERGCPRVTATFRARLKGRPNASRPADAQRPSRARR
jgi:hypothetical protein